jgi:hypothetical protein
MSGKQPTTTIPTELLMALVKLLDIAPPILLDWIQTTGYGEIHDRDLSALFDFQRAIDLHHEFMKENGVQA